MAVLETKIKEAKLAEPVLTQEYPCDFTIDEVAEACEKAIKQHEEGTTIPLSQIKRKIS